MENNQKASRPRAPRAPKAATPGVSDTRQNTAAPAAKPAASQTGAVPAAAPKPARRPYHPRRRRPAAASAGTPAVPVKIMPLGGLGEVGKNITLYECQGDMILVDCGIVFPDSDMFGVDLVIPDFTYVVQNKDRIKGVVITHGHEDHIGGLPYLLKEVNLPIYATRLTIGLITNKLEEHGLVRSTKMVEIAPHQKFKLGCFTVEPIHVNHSNLYRVQQLIDLAVKAGRKVAVSGRSMVNNTQMALELGYLHAPETVLIDIEDINKYPPEKIVLITTGSQGEPLSALSRMAAASHRNVRVGEGDFIIISANPIPGNEKMVTKVVNGLLKLGAEVIYESMYDVHVSGHACQEEQKLMLTLAKPQFFLPVHGEYKHLKKHAQTAAAVGIPEKNIYIGENGDCVVLSADGLTVGEPVPAGAVMVDGLGVGDVGNVVLRDRRHLSEDGLVIVVATIDARTGEVLAGPDLVSRGFVYVRESEKLLDDARDQVRDVLGRMSAADKRDFGSVKTRIRETVSAFLYRKTKRSPMILPILMEV